MVAKILGAQHDFSYGEVDATLKRSDDHPARKGGLRQMANMRILNSGALQDRSGRRALFPISGGGLTRIEKFTIAAGHNYKIGFGNGLVQLIDNTETTVAGWTTQGNGFPLPWTTANLGNVVYAVFGQSVYITFPGMVPQVLSWDGVTTWSRADYAELVIGNQKRTPFYRIAPQGITILPSAQTGVVTVAASAPVFTALAVLSRIRFVGRQLLITGFTDSQHVTATVEEALPGSQTINFSPTDATTIYNVGDVVIGTVTGSKGIITGFSGASNVNITVQLLTLNSSSIFTPGNFSFSGGGGGAFTAAFTVADTVVGPGGAIKAISVSAIGTPAAVADWDEEVFNGYRGWPASCFVDQFRLGFTNFPSVPGGIAWSSINSPTDLYVGANPSDAMFEIAPAKTQVLYVVPGPESSEFVFCADRLYYIPISPTNPLKPGSVQFQILSGDGAAQVQPRLAQEGILYVNAGRNSVMAVIATGAYLRPFNTKNLSDFHSHLFNAIVAIAAPNADGTFNERYAYVLNGDGTITVGKYNPESLQGNLPVIGWGPWSSASALTVVNWISAWNADVFFTSMYFASGTGVCEILDDSKYLDCSLFVNALPASFTPPGGKGPLWFIPGATVALIDQVTRFMGIYQIDANGFIVPQNNGGEDLTLASLVAGQPWTVTVEPFCPAAQPGSDINQRINKRQVSRFAVWVIQSTGFLLGRLFSGPITPTSPALGTVMNERRFPAWNQGDDATKPPPLRETVEDIPPGGSNFDPRLVLIKDSPGPLQLLEIAIEVSV